MGDLTKFESSVLDRALSFRRFLMRIKTRSSTFPPV